MTLHLSGCASLDVSPGAEGTGIQIGGAIYAAIKYKELTAAEAERVRVEAQRVFDQKVQREVERQRARVKRPGRPDRMEPPRKPAERPSATGVSPSETPPDAPDQPTQEETAVLDESIREAAVEAVKQKYGTNIAVPVMNPDNKAVVAFASVVGERVTLATRTAYELNISSAQVARAAERNRPVELEGASYALLDETSVSISSP